MQCIHQMMGCVCGYVLNLLTYKFHYSNYSSNVKEIQNVEIIHKYIFEICMAQKLMYDWLQIIGLILIVVEVLII